MQIRPATQQDIPRILDLGCILHAESYYRGYPLDLERARAAIDELLDHPDGACLLLAENRHRDLVGMLAVRMGLMLYFNRPVAQEQMFYVHPDARGSSAAVKLLLACRQWAANRGASEVMVSINGGIALDRLPRLMERLEFRQVGEAFSLRLAPMPESAA